MAELWFIRHFRTPWNAGGRFQGQRDIGLDDPLGEGDRAALARNLAQLRGQGFARVLTSPLARARATAAHHGFPGAEPLADLAEIHFGPLEGWSRAELETRYPGAWETAPQTLPLGESFADFAARVERIHAQAAACPGPVLVFGHGAWLGCLRSLAAGGNGSDLALRGCGNGELVRIAL